MRAALLGHVHVDEVLAGLEPVDDDVVAGGGLVGVGLHAAGAGGDDRRAALGEYVLALVVAAGAEAVAVLVPAAERELVAVVLEPGPGAGAAAEGRDLEAVVAVGGDPARLGRGRSSPGSGS